MLQRTQHSADYDLCGSRASC